MPIVPVFSSGVVFKNLILNSKDDIKNSILPEIITGEKIGTFAIYENDKYSKIQLSPIITSEYIEHDKDIIIKSLKIKTSQFQKELISNNKYTNINIVNKNDKQDIIEFDIANLNITHNEKLSIEGIASIENEIKEYNFSINSVAGPIRTEGILDSNIDKLIKKYPFISKNENTYYFKSGIHEIDDFLIFPNGFSVEISKYTTISFAESAGLLINGAFKIKGSNSNKNILKSKNDKPWKGITVINANNINENSSEISNTIIKNVKNTSYKSWKKTGSINFVNSNISISHSMLSNNYSEDMLNVINSDFKISNSNFNNIYSDAFDSDFSTGEIINTNFINVGGDGIDLSTSEVKIKNINFNNIYDKSVSVGEKSIIHVTNTFFENSNVGLACKDSSICEITDSTFKNIYFADLMAFVKKNIFGPSKIKSTNNKFQPPLGKLISDNTSEIYDNGTLIEQTKINIKKLYEESFMKKKEINVN